MGLETECTVKLGRKTFVGKALLEGQSLIFRGEQPLEIPFERIREVTAEEGTLVVATDEQEARFELGPQLAERWMRLIKEPKGLFEKLELGPQSRVAVVEVADPLFATALRERVSNLVEGRVPQGTPVIFFGAETREALRKIQLLRARLVDTGALWIIRPKGSKTLTEADVSNATREAGLVEAKVVTFSRTHVAHKCVVPVEMRGQERRRPPILSIPPTESGGGSAPAGTAHAKSGLAGPSRLKARPSQPPSGSGIPAADSKKSAAEEKKRR
ncbi:MAG: hypothetical protein M3O36_07245 [Myxococcota bacterium]|nr:hypothetical protein [Myxococcota bacterium]